MKRLCPPLLVVALVCMCSSTSANAFDAPPRKSGIWELKTQTGNYKQVMHLCVDAASEAKDIATRARGLKANCSKVDQRMEGGKLIGDLDCFVAGKQVKSHSVTTFNGDNAYSTDVTSAQEATHIDGKWLVPCTPWMEPGTRVDPR